MLLGNNVVSEVRWARWSPQKNLSVSLLFYLFCFLLCPFFFCGVLWFCLVAVLALVFISVDLCVDGCIVCFVFFAFASCFFCWGAVLDFLLMCLLVIVCVACLLLFLCLGAGLCWFAVRGKRWEKWWLTIIYTWILRIVEISTPKPKSINFAKIKEKRTPERLFPLLNGFFHTKAHFEPFFDLQIACVFDQKRN